MVLGGQPIQSEREFAFLHSLKDHTWSTEPIVGEGFEARSHFGLSRSQEGVYLYGGQGDEQVLEGLFLLDTDLFQVTRLDAGADPAPGPRAGAALEYRALTHTIRLFGGEDDQGRLHTDVWEFNLDTGRWRRLAGDCEGASCPPPMREASILSNPYDGSLHVLTGRQRTTASAQPAWTLEGDSWTSFAQRLQPADELPSGCSGCSSQAGPGASPMLLCLWVALLLARRLR